jgi:hypothetical protein
MTNPESTINFMYFANNYSPAQLKAVFAVTNAPAHCEAKFHALSDRFNGNGTQMFFHWFMQMSSKVAICYWIDVNYKAF